MQPTLTTPTFRILDLSDAEFITNFGRECFQSAFTHMNKPENMAKYVADAFNISQLESELSDPDIQFVLAEVNNHPAGYAKLKKGVPPDCVSAIPSLEINRLYVSSDFIGNRIGAALMNKCLELAQSYQSVWLSSWKINERANRFYFNFGFEIKGEQMFQMGNEPQEDYILVKLIN